MTKYTIEEMKAMLEMGFTHQQIVDMSNEVATVGSKTTKTTKGKTPTGSKAKTTKKTTKSTKTEGFDRELYEAKAKELGCFNHGKVVATVENGKVVRNAKENRELVYKAMGIK